LTSESPPAKEAVPNPTKKRTYRPPRPITDLRHDLPDDLVAVINTMLATDSADRYQTPADVVKALDPFTQPGKASAKPTAKRAPSPPPPSVVEPARPEPPGFAAQCPFCQTRTRVPLKSRGASVPCPTCKCYFTAVSDKDMV